MRHSREYHGIAGAASTLARYEADVIPQAIRKIEKLQNEYTARVAAARQQEHKLKLTAEMKRIAPHKALGVLEAAGLRFRLGEGDSIEIAGALDDRAEAIVESYYEAIVGSLKARENWRPVKRSAA
jgi:hypothetical protein